MVKRSAPDEIGLDEIMQESMKEMGKGETVSEPITEQLTPETPSSEPPKPQFGFKLGEVKTPESFVVKSKKEEPEEGAKKQVILDKPSQSLDDDIIVDW
jgi:hypothetical protein